MRQTAETPPHPQHVSPKKPVSGAGCHLRIQRLAGKHVFSAGGTQPISGRLRTFSALPKRVVPQRIWSCPMRHTVDDYRREARYSTPARPYEHRPAPNAGHRPRHGRGAGRQHCTYTRWQPCRLFAERYPQPRPRKIGPHDPQPHPRQQDNLDPPIWSGY